jgi:hypothetical protein
MILNRLLHEKHQFRLALFGHKAVETGGVCLVLMTQGRLEEATLAHVLIAAKTGVLAVFPVLGITLTKYARYLGNRWTSSLFVGTCGFLADGVAHHSHYPGEYTEAVLTGIGTFIFSILVSYTPVGKYIDRLTEAFL